MYQFFRILVPFLKLSHVADSHGFLFFFLFCIPLTRRLFKLTFNWISIFYSEVTHEMLSLTWVEMFK